MSSRMNFSTLHFAPSYPYDQLTSPFFETFMTAWRTIGTSLSTGEILARLDQFRQAQVVVFFLLSPAAVHPGVPDPSNDSWQEEINSANYRQGKKGADDHSRYEY